MIATGCSLFTETNKKHGRLGAKFVPAVKIGEYWNRDNVFVTFA